MRKSRKELDARPLQNAARQLRADEREALRLSAAERLSYDEIAVRLGIPRGGVEDLIARALCKLDRALERRERPWWKFW